MQSQLKFKEINNSLFFNAFSERPINLNLHHSYVLNSKWALNTTFVFLSGLPMTVPNSYFSVLGKDRSVVVGTIFSGSASREEFNELNLISPEIQGPWQYHATQINNNRTSNYHRLDINITRTVKKGNRETNLSFGVYNVYINKNPFVTYLVNDDNKFKLRNYSLFNFLPFLTFRYKL